MRISTHPSKLITHLHGKHVEFDLLPSNERHQVANVAKEEHEQGRQLEFGEEVDETHCDDGRVEDVPEFLRLRPASEKTERVR